MAKRINIEQSPDLLQQPNVEFRGNDFDAAVWNKGYDVIIESAVKCPCRTRNNDHLSECKNCLGTGWVFINATQDRAIITSINSETKYKEWSEEKLGTVSITLQRRGYLSYMDKITVKDSQVKQSEVIYPMVSGTNFFAYTIYNVDSVVEIFEFESSDSPLKLLELDTDYTISDNKIIIVTTNQVADITALKALTGYSSGDKSLVEGLEFIYIFDSASTETPDGDAVIIPDDIVDPAAGRWIRQDNFSVSIRYNHKLQYYVLDTPHTIRNSYKKNGLGREELQLLPIHGIGRLVHWVIDALDFDGDNIIDNSYQE